MRQAEFAEPHAMEAFRAVPAGAALMIGDRRNAEAGLRLFRKKQIGALRWAQGGVTATFEKNQVTVNLYPEPASSIIRHRCCCDQWRVDGACPHVVAAAAALYYAIDGRTFGVPPPPEKYRARLGVELGIPSRPEVSAPKSGREVGWVLSESATGLSLCLSPASGRVPAPCAPGAAEDIARLAGEAQSAGGALWWRCPDGRGLLRIHSGPPIPARAVLHADLVGDRMVEIGARAMAGATCLAPVAKLGPGVLLGADGRLALIIEDPSDGWARPLIPASWWAGATRVVPAETFNAVALNRAPLWRSGEPPILLRHDGRTVALSLRPPFGKLGSLASPCLRGAPEAVSGRLKTFLRDDGGERGICSASPDRQRVLAGAMRALLNLPAGKDPGAVISAAAESRAMRLTGRSEGARRFLLGFWDAVAMEPAGAIPVATPGESLPWALVDPDLRQLARLAIKGSA